jgi:hypothetical protein
VAEPGSPARSRNHLAWIAPLVAIAGFLSYYAFFSRWPVFRDVPWLNLLILLGATALSVIGLRRARPGWGRAGSIAGLVVSAGLLGLLVYYCFVFSYGLPDPNRVVADGTRIPSITLASWDGRPVDVAEAARGDLILVFYRGYW